MGPLNTSAGSGPDGLGRWLPLWLGLIAVALTAALHFAGDRRVETSHRAIVARDEIRVEQARETAQKANAALQAAQERLQRDRATLSALRQP